MNTDEMSRRSMISREDRIYWKHYREMQELDTPVAVIDSNVKPERQKVLVSVLSY